MDGEGGASATGLGHHTGLSRAPTRRRFLVGAGAAFGAALLSPATVRAEPHDDSAQWLANHMATRLMGADGAPATWLPTWTHMRLLRGLPNGWLEVWVPRAGLVGRVPAAAIGPIPAPSPEELAAERTEPFGPPVIEPIGMPGRIIGSANLRLWPAARSETLLRSLGHNAPVRIIARVEGDDGAEWFHAQWFDGAMQEKLGEGYIETSLVRLPRLPYVATAADHADRSGRWFEADLREPALITAFENGAPLWASMAIKGRTASRTRLGSYEIQWQVANETMNSETLIPPVPRNSPRGYYLTNVLWTQYFHWDGSSIHYNYWSSNWGYAGSNGCLGLPRAEAKFAWDFAEIGTPVRIFA
jgi:hypothetical protein